MARRSPVIIRTDEQGVTLTSGETAVMTIPWDGITRIMAYQTDNITIDTIWKSIEGRGGPVQVSEDHIGFRGLCEAITRHLTTNPDWFATLTRTSFDRDETLVFERSKSPEPPDRNR